LAGTLFLDERNLELMFGRKAPKTVLTCPQCGSADLYYETGLITGYKYHCKKCGYIGAFVIEKDMKEPRK